MQVKIGKKLFLTKIAFESLNASVDVLMLL